MQSQKKGQNFILTAQKGEGLLFAMNDRIPITIVASDKEYEIIGHQPDELNKKEQAKKDFVEKTEKEEHRLGVFKLDNTFYEREGLGNVDYFESNSGIQNALSVKFI